MNNLHSLQQKLEIQKNWPMDYMFKFIVPAEIEKIAMVEALFSDQAIVYRNESKTGKFISITARQQMESPEHIIAVYEKAQSIENIMAL